MSPCKKTVKMTHPHIKEKIIITKYVQSTTKCSPKNKRHSYHQTVQSEWYITHSRPPKQLFKHCNISGLKDFYLAAVISSQTVKHDKADTSEKHEAIIAKRGQRKSFAFIKRASPGFCSFSHSARSPNSSAGMTLLHSLRKEFPILFSEHSFVDELLVFFAECMLFRTVSMWVLSRGSLNSLAAWENEIN